MSSDDNECPPKQLLQPLSYFQPPQPNSNSLTMATQEISVSRKPYQITFSSREEEIRYTAKLMENCTTYNGDPEQLSAWLKETSVFIAREGYPETDHPFIIRHLLMDDALDYYLAHEDIVFNFYDLRKLFLHKQNSLAPLRTISSLDSVASPPIFSSTELTTTTNANMPNPPATTTLSFAQSLEDLTQNDIRKTIIEDLQRNTTKFTGEQRQDVIKWLTSLECKFETAGIPAVKKFDLMSQLLDKEALEWFQDNKAKFNHSWSDFVEHFKKTFDSPNRARIAMQKLNSYAQSPQQDIRSFCSEMRKLFHEADPQMSSTMKLELLLAKVNPSYRLDLLKQKPKDIEEFETMAKDLENTYLVYDAIEQNVQSNTSFSSESSRSSNSATYHQPAAQGNSYNRNNNFRYSNTYYNPRSWSNTNSSFRNSSPNSSDSQNRIQSHPRATSSSPGTYYTPRNNPRNTLRSTLSTYQAPSAGQQPQQQQITAPFVSIIYE